ncbi:hypothetical protein EHF33_17285 (plasmid) [Deinococcus psychrotolerans]|uniref:histidine kinase n=1 Tax=Deinococcus psychrotolerans TaxID=2489213 RepID=A0A3G8YSD3_9DEIO|nr:ATP-binding protein [Deinococcus psychrotolerans]AZI44651.1 hypothetical protein EHF33_17285 [Deinococcus psychrotolerans]
MSDSAPPALRADTLLERLWERSQALSAAADFAQVYTLTLSALQTDLGATSAAIVLNEPRGSGVRVVAQQGAALSADLLRPEADPESGKGVIVRLQGHATSGHLAFEVPEALSRSERHFVGSLAAHIIAALDRLEEQDKSATPPQAGPPLSAPTGTEQSLSGAANQAAASQAEALEAFVRFTEVSAQSREVPVLAQKAIEVLQSTLGGVSAAYYQPEEDHWQMNVWSADLPPEAVARLRSGRYDAPSFRQALALGEPLFVDGWDPRDDGMEPSQAYRAVAIYPFFQDGAACGALTAASRDTAVWTTRERTVFRAVGRSFGLALERAEHRRALEERTEALDAFVRFSEASSQTNDLAALSEQAFSVLDTFFPNFSGTLHERSDEHWELRAFTPNLSSDLTQRVVLGLPLGTPLFTEALESGEAHFVDDWHDSVPGSGEPFRTTGVYPVLISGQVRAFLSVWLRNRVQWHDRDRAIVRAVGRSLNLALERADADAALRTQGAELAARTKALEAFSALTRDLTLQAEELSLVRRAQEVALSMLPPGTALYYRLEGELWRLKSQVGDLGEPELQRLIDAGLPFEATQNLLIPWTTRQPYYQGRYDPDTDNLAEFTHEVGATATLPVMVAGEPTGVFVVALFGQQIWSAAERATLEAVVGSLGLAKEGARSVLALRERSGELERSNHELEQFAYVASHDLQEPLRTVTSFAQLLVGKYRGQLDPKADVYLSMITEGTGRMSRLLQDLLAFSRVSTSAQPMKAVALSSVLEAVGHDLQNQIQRSQATLEVGPLPSVQGDATQLRQVFQNLVGNAIKFSAPDRLPAVSVIAQPDGPHWRFAISDNGIGIAPAFFERIFTIFQRLHSREQYEGSGIGLAIARKIVERHGGQMWLESEEGQGSTFFFTLPDADKTVAEVQG